jgi:hypothetical protein
MRRGHQSEDDRWPDDEDDESDDLEGWDDPDTSDEGDEDVVDTEPCPHCGRPVYEQAQLCPHCGNYISLSAAPQRRPMWIVIGVILGLAVIGIWLFSR